MKKFVLENIAMIHISADKHYFVLNGKDDGETKDTWDFLTFMSENEGQRDYYKLSYELLT